MEPFLIRRLSATLLAAAFALGPAAARNVLAADPVANADSYTVIEDQTLTVDPPGVLGNDDHDPGTTACVLDVNTAGLDGNVAGSPDGGFTFVPLPDTNGPTSFTYDMAAYSTGSCPAIAESTGTVSISVTPVNDAPTAVVAATCDGGVSVAEDSGPFDDPDHCVELHDWGPVDEVRQSLEGWVVSTNQPDLFSSGPSISVVDDTFGRLHFTPAANVHGSATVTVRGRDSGGTANGGVDLSPAIGFTLTITSANDAPTAFADSFIALADRTLNIKSPGVLFNDSDIDGDSLSAVKVTSPAHGIVTLAADGAFSYTPSTGYRGLDAFSYRATDGTASSPTRIVTLSVTAIPTASPTPIPTIAPPSGAPSPEATLAEPSPSASIEASPSLEPGESPGETPLATTGASALPGPTPVPGPAAGSGGGLSLPALLLMVLLAVLIAFGAAIYVPKWLSTARTGRPPDNES